MSSSAGTGSWVGSLLLVGLAALLVASTACHDSGRRTPSPTAGSTGAGVAAEPAPSDEVTPQTEDALAVLLCRGFEDWPRLLVDPAFAGSLEAEVAASSGVLSVEQRAQIEPSGIVERARAVCPAVLVAERVGPRGLPRPADRLADLPGLFPAEAPADAAEARIVLEWTAIGLGCAGLDSLATQAELLGYQDALLGGMGYTLASYVDASLANADSAMSDRIFEGIRACAERVGAHVAE